METKFNFNSQICTTRKQSKRLLALGIKRETADMYYSYDIICAKPYYKVIEFMNGCVQEDIFPSWSLHRLLEMNLNSTDTRFEVRFNQLDVKDAYEFLIAHIEWLIKEGYFLKEYLEE